MKAGRQLPRRRRLWQIQMTEEQRRWWRGLRTLPELEPRWLWPQELQTHQKPEPELQTLLLRLIPGRILRKPGLLWRFEFEAEIDYVTPLSLYF